MVIFFLMVIFSILIGIGLIISVLYLVYTIKNRRTRRNIDTYINLQELGTDNKGSSLDECNELSFFSAEEIGL